MAEVKVGQVYKADAGAPDCIKGVRRTVVAVDGDGNVTYTAVDLYAGSRAATTITRTLPKGAFLRGAELA